jgi:hypothetical protein
MNAWQGLFFILLLMILYVLFNDARGDTTTATIRSATTYATLDEAVRNELRPAMAMSANVRIEIGGAIYERNGVYYPSTWVYGEAHGIPNFGVGIYRDAKIVAIWHTHPDPDPARSDGFSEADAKAAHIIRADAYVGVVTNDSIRVLRVRDIRPGEHKRFHSMPGELTSL